MPTQVTKALVLLGRALTLDPTHALAHANVAHAPSLSLSAGAGCVKQHWRWLRSVMLKPPSRMAVTMRVHLTLAGFSIGMDSHD